MTVEATVFEKGYKEGYGPEANSARRAPWDIGRAQPAVVEIAEQGAFGGAVLDIGCGLGENASHLASRGLNVTAIDSAPSAVCAAAQRAEAKGLQIEFAVADALSLDGYEDRFDSILDSGLFHCIKPEERKPYAEALARVAKPGARLNLLSFTSELPEGFLVTVGEDTLRENFVAPWTVESVSKIRYETTLNVEQLRARVPGLDENGLVDGEPCAGLEVDETGTVWFDAWYMVARRS